MYKYLVNVTILMLSLILYQRGEFLEYLSSTGLSIIIINHGLSLRVYKTIND